MLKKTIPCLAVYPEALTAWKLNLSVLLWQHLLNLTLFEIHLILGLLNVLRYLPYYYFGNLEKGLGAKNHQPIKLGLTSSH